MRAVWWFLPAGLLVGLVWAVAFRVSWRVFGEVGGLRLLPALAVVLVDVAFVGYRQYWGLGRIVGGRSGGQSGGDDGTRRALGLVVSVLAFWVLLVAIPAGPVWWPTDWRADWHLTKLYPRPVFRPLILAPMWGRWAMLMAGNVGRARDDAGADAPLCGPVQLPAVLVSFVLLILLTAVYCSRGGNGLLGLIIGFVVFGATHLVSTLLARRRGGQDFASLFAISKVAELTFLLAYISATSRGA